MRFQRIGVTVWQVFLPTFHQSVCCWQKSLPEIDEPPEVPSYFISRLPLVAVPVAEMDTLVLVSAVTVMDQGSWGLWMVMLPDMVA